METINDPKDGLTEQSELEDQITPQPRDGPPAREQPKEQKSEAIRARKRTKTGCLTCRKRRVKCGEERPLCANCVKSKRNCEGYAPRHTFRDPMSAYAQHGWPGRGYALPPDPRGPYVQSVLAASGHRQFPLIAPRPSQDQRIPTDQNKGSLAPGSQTSAYQDSTAILSQAVSTITTSQDRPYENTTHHIQNRPHDASDTRRSSSQLTHTVNLSTTAAPASDSYYQQSNNVHLPPTNGPAPAAYHPRMNESTISPAFYVPTNSQNIGVYQSLTEIRPSLPLDQMASRDYPQQHQYDQEHPAVAQLLEDDEFYDVDSDEEMNEPEAPASAAVEKKRRDLSHVLAVSRQGRNLRTVEAFLHKPNVLATYAPKFSSSPLMDEATARIFCHFVTATGPLLSAYGRHPVNPALLFSGNPVPKAQQALWTYTIPMLAISNQALLHAVLAVASLNIARLQQAPLTVPIKHYQFALQRVAKAVATPGKRTAIATVAATILLSQFEILSAEHSKWHSHLAGARQLLTEIDFAQWTNRIQQERARRDVLAQNGSHSNRFVPFSEDLPWLPVSGSDDERVLNQIIGTSIRKDFRGHTQHDKPSLSQQPVTEKEMDDFQTYRDLFWMYTKIDNIQSFVSGRRLLLPLDRWAHCPPRAPLNRFDAVYGTLDYVAILLGRVADFAGKDVVRKRRVVKANGGVWRPPPGMFGPPGAIPPQGPAGMPGMSAPPGQAQQMPTPPGSGQTPSTPQQNSGPPTGLQPTSRSSTGSSTPNGPPQNPMGNAPSFSGLLPDAGPEQGMPAAFSQAPRNVLYHSKPTEYPMELSEATSAAEAEWNSIQEAFAVFEQSLGPAFSPLAPDAGPPIKTAFGPALQYRTFQIAVCWLLFYMAKIISIRTHPAMPPASMVATGVAASKTAQYCNVIGRINGGLQLPAPDQPLNPIFGGAITEMMLPLFVAGVQFMENAQRVTTVERLQFIADRIGHDSAALIAAGLEKTWIKMHDAGRGPKYIPSVRVQDEYGRDLTTQQRNDPAGNGEIRVPRGPARDLAGRETSKNKNRGAVILQNDTRSFAAGVMGLEENLGNLDINDDGSG